ncbi:VanZ family protein [Flavobacterium chungbukense]|uniref:VanZ-like domain-containing protein n=1 Tax=Flavobacterium chungbukense TaxID=877464 RepID=A0ABP7YIR8_9FLAO|nr:VanZ family protein [Flavobacterium chungbukense]MCC4920190.1 VanZ family protein [Flavobacterium chungbukense]
MVYKIVVLVLLFFVIAAVFYFSWLSDPSFMEESYLPVWLLNWSNKYYNLRTAIPFLALGFLLEIYTEYNGFNNNKKLNFKQNIVFAAIIVCVAEGGQFIIQRRNPDLMDVFYGIAGSIIGAVSYNLLKKLRNAKQT